MWTELVLTALHIFKRNTNVDATIIVITTIMIAVRYFIIMRKEMCGGRIEYQSQGTSQLFLYCK
jgi:hypothetical protein